MSSFHGGQSNDDYDHRSLKHERQMMATYRTASARDGASLQPLANSCWRAACFEWKLYRSVGTTRRLLGEAARTLARGFLRRRPGFDPNPEQYILGLHASIAARERDAFIALAAADPNPRTGILREARAFLGSRTHFRLAEGYALVARAVIEREQAKAREACQMLEAARVENEREWWERQFPDPLEAAWRNSEHEAVCVLLAAVAGRIVSEAEAAEAGQTLDESEETLKSFASVVDRALERLQEFVERDVNHHPKLYLWLPGIALCGLASSAGVPLDWLERQHEANNPVYQRLPLELLGNQPSN
ncbi:MAG TPA: hypothetical protein VGB73_09925 [Pyrinomonadaceae bacterium]|jgi:hypothetical protein